MKKILIFLLLICSSYSYALQTTLTSSIYASEIANYSTQNTANTPTNIRRVRFVNRMDTCPEIEVALAAANTIFSSKMYSESINLVPIEAEVEMGSPSEFAQNEVCKVSVIYTDTLLSNVFYYYFNQYLYSDISILVPKAIQNQCKGYSSGPCMLIKLNPNISYYYGASTDIPADKYDAVTILLRALAIGCGIQSTLNPYSMQFGLTIDNQTYINPFDYHIYNDLNYTYSDVILNQISANNFLGERLIFADGYSDRYGITPQPVSLFNDWELDVYGMNVTTNTLNTINPFGYTEDEVEDNFIDLLDPYIPSGYSQRTITPYTMALLRGLGWIETIPVGPEASYLYDFYNSELVCNGNTLLPNNVYTVELYPNNHVISDLFCEIESIDSTYIIGGFTGGNSFSYQSIPANVQWRRNTMSKNIIGHIHGKIGTLIDDAYYEIEKIHDIEVPYKPDKIQVQKSESTTNGYVSLNLNAFANGSNIYTIMYTGVTLADTHSFTTTADALDTIINSIPGTQLYNMSIWGSNNVGNSDTCSFTFGFSAHPMLYMTLSINGNILTYDLSNNGTIDITDLIISSVQITDQNGGMYATPQVGSGEPINISFLSRGYYVLTVVADGNVYSRMFIKR